MPVIKFTSGEEVIKLTFRNLPTPMVEWSGTAKELHDIIFGAWLNSDKSEEDSALRQRGE